MNKLIIGIFESNDAAGNAVADLKQKGYTDRISVVTKKYEDGELDTETYQIKTEAAEAATGGAVAGGIIGALGAAIAGVTTAVIPGVNILVAGVIVSALGGAAIGGLVGALTEYGLNEAQAKDLENKVMAGDVLVVVEAEETYAEDVEAVMRSHTPRPLMVTERSK